jgi:hypothetical protein
MRFEHGVVAVWRPDGKLLESESLLAEGPDIVEQNEALGVSITPESVAAQWDGRRLTQDILADTVEGLLWLEDRHGRDLAAAIRVPTGESLDGCDPDYPPFIVIDDDCDDFDEYVPSG